MQSFELRQWRKYPKVAAFVERALGQSYRKKRVVVTIAASVTMHDVNWSGGTRAEYVLFTCAPVPHGDSPC